MTARIISYSEVTTTRREEDYTSESDARRWFHEYVEDYKRLGDPDMLFWVRLEVNHRTAAVYSNVPDRHSAANFIAK